MRRAILILCAILLLGLPAGALTPHWRSTAPSDVTTLSISADGSYILTGGERVCLFAGDGTPLWREWSADLVACSADGSRIACADGQSLFLLDREGAMVWRQEMPSTSALLALSADGKRIVVADRFGKVYFYTMQRGNSRPRPIPAPGMSGQRSTPSRYPTVARTPRSYPHAASSTTGMRAGRSGRMMR